MDKKIYLDGKEVTIEELEEAKANPAVRIVEDKNNPGHYTILKRLKG